MRNAKKDLELCEKAKITCNKDDGVRYAELAKYWIKRAEVLNKMLIKSVFYDKGVKWDYEDCLPKNCDYDSMFEHSRIIGGVRMFPFIKIDGKKYFIGDGKE